jgi:alkaline phosphatase
VEGAWSGDDHTAVDTIVWSEGPGSEGLAKALDNTDVYDVLVRAMK